MSAMASQINSPTIVFSTVYSGRDERKHQSSASLAFARGIHRWPVNSPHKGPVTRKMFPFDDVIMESTPVDRNIMFPCYTLISSLYCIQNIILAIPISNMPENYSNCRSLKWSSNQISSFYVVFHSIYEPPQWVTQSFHWYHIIALAIGQIQQ